MTPNQETKNTYTGIQALRFVAAMLVVLAHSTAMVNERMHAVLGRRLRPTKREIQIEFQIII
jgi:peptidoglycan/LPS O-acetylase OafA/YrhL